MIYRDRADESTMLHQACITLTLTLGTEWAYRSCEVEPVACGKMNERIAPNHHLATLKRALLALLDGRLGRSVALAINLKHHIHSTIVLHPFVTRYRV